MQENTLRELVSQGKSTYQIASALNISQTNVRYWLKKLDLKTSPSYYSRKIKCKLCGEKDIEKMMIKGGGRRAKTICKKCHNIRTIERQRKNKKAALEYKGNKCKRCNYNKCTAALEFHHRDPGEKDPNWINLRSWSLDRIYKELDKCDLVCANCHREIHYGDIV